MCGSADGVLSILTASTEPPSPVTGSPVRGDSSTGALVLGATLATLGVGSEEAPLDPPQAATVASTATAAVEARTVRVRGVRRARRGVFTRRRVRGGPEGSAPA